jgi:alginate O-acetyltransferase complex protein AlgI
MLFDTPVYLIFLTLVVLVYWRLGFLNQNRFLLASSYLFYGWWDWRFLILMVSSTIVDYAIARKIASEENRRLRKGLLTISLVLNFGLLGFFKYFNFFTDSLASTLSLIGVGQPAIHFLTIILPPGISFYTFQEVAYIVDVYFRKLEPAESLLDYMLFISLFPHLIAGPIQRPSHLLPQVQQPRVFNQQAFFDGCMLIASGLFRKCVIADQCALIANAAFDGRFGNSGLATIFGAVAFAFQIYGDFSGYSDIARGSAQLLGFHFMVNFRQPYLAGSLRDFWRRWHISLSTWLRDYLYIPLGGNRVSEAETFRNLMATMVLGGLWHGASWTFVVWGAIQGVGLSFERWLAKAGDEAGTRTGVWPRRLTTFTVVCAAWIFFRAASLKEALHVFQGLGVWEWRPYFATVIGILIVVCGLMLAVDLRLEKYEEEYVFQHAALPQQLAIFGCFVGAVILFSASQSNAFIYFQF